MKKIGNDLFWLSVAAVLTAPMYTLGYVIGFLSRPTYKGFLDGLIVLQESQEKKVQRYIDEESRAE